MGWGSRLRFVQIKLIFHGKGLLFLSSMQKLNPHPESMASKILCRQHNKVGCNGKKIFALAVKQARKACRNQFVTFWQQISIGLVYLCGLIFFFTFLHSINRTYLICSRILNPSHVKQNDVYQSSSDTFMTYKLLCYWCKSQMFF